MITSFIKLGQNNQNKPNKQQKQNQNQKTKTILKRDE